MIALWFEACIAAGARFAEGGEASRPAGPGRRLRKGRRNRRKGGVRRPEARSQAGRLSPIAIIRYCLLSA